MSIKPPAGLTCADILRTLGYGPISTGGGCTAMHYALPGGSYILVTGSDRDQQDKAPPARARWVTMGLYDNDSQPIRTRLQGSEYGGARVHVSELPELTEEYARTCADIAGSGDVTPARTFHWSL